LLIDGERVEAEEGGYLGVENPASEDMFAEVPAGGPKDVDKAAHMAFTEWSESYSTIGEVYCAERRYSREKRRGDSEIPDHGVG